MRRSFKQGIVCGYVAKADHSLHLNPDDQQVIAWGDRLIVLANDGEPHCSVNKQTACLAADTCILLAFDVLHSYPLPTNKVCRCSGANDAHLQGKLQSSVGFNAPNAVPHFCQSAVRYHIHAAQVLPTTPAMFKTIS